MKKKSKQTDNKDKAQNPSINYKLYYEAIETAFIVYELGLPTGYAEKDLNTLLCYVSELEKDRYEDLD